uniref:uncharacterized protein LOC122587203 n=1 Tax=Erigeron canadensis TaxID=72917 RepID=UPI001CB9A99B|nr:uncharacterized protein LOC122587203 [Erigeron canadensis]
MNFMNAMVLFLLIITTTTISSVWCSSSNNDEKIIMVVEEQTSYMQPGVAEKLVPLGRFVSKDGKSVALSRPQENCVGLNGDPCGRLHPCCEGLSCDGYFKGKCNRISNCLPLGSTCLPPLPTIPSRECCYPRRCKKFFSKRTYFKGVLSNESWEKKFYQTSQSGIRNTGFKYPGQIRYLKYRIQKGNIESGISNTGLNV